MLRSLSLPPPAFLMPITTASRRALAGGTNPHLTRGCVGVGCLRGEEYSEFLICIMCVCEMPRGLGWVVSFVSKEAWRWWGGCLKEEEEEEVGLGFMCGWVGGGPGICRGASGWSWVGVSQG